jgi:hypothetical protein
MLRSKRENAQWAKKTTRTLCGNSETATTRNFTSWMFCNSHNTFWHVKNCHYAKFASWLLDKMTARSGNTELSERVVVVSFYSHDTMWGKSYRTVEEGFSKWTVYKLKRYEVIKIGDTQKLTESGSGENYDSNIRYYWKMEELFHVLKTTHLNTGHKRTRGKTLFCFWLAKIFSL